MKKHIEHLLNTCESEAELRKGLISLLYSEPKKHTTPDLYWGLYEFQVRSVSIIERWLERNGNFNPTLEELSEIVSKEKLEAIAGCGANTISDVKKVFSMYKLNFK